MRFKKPDMLFLFGGADALASVVEAIMANEMMPVCVYTCERQLNESLTSGETLRNALDKSGVEYHSTEDINTCPGLKERITDSSLGIGFGEAWSFDAEIIEAFNGNLLDLMGIRLPQYRGGAHYTWQILTGNRIGACNLQVINEDMVQGKHDSGDIIKFKEYLFPAHARIPRDYFRHAVEQEIAFILDFINMVNEGAEFKPFPLQNNFSLFMPRLNTMKQGYIDWSWSAEDIDRFICAFDEPYAGAGTFVNGREVRVKSSRMETGDGSFHPFQAGLIYKIYENAVYIATTTGTVVIERITDSKGNDMMHTLETGQRLYTPQGVLEKAMLFSAEYTAAGLKE